MTKILFAGDLCPTGRIEKIVLEGDQNRVDDIFKDILPYVKQSDYFVVNLECPLTHGTDPIEKIGPNLKADPKTIMLLNNLGANLVSLANNHIYDYGQTGLCETLQSCKDYGIATVGAGAILKAAQKPQYATIQGMRVAFVNFAEHEFCNANANQGGANSLDIVDNTRQIQIARSQADAVIVIIHGGHEHFYYPSPRMVKQYRFFAEQGAMAIIGHHTHCVSGYEIHKGVPIFYSLGNFLFDSKTNFPGWYEGYMVELEIGNSKGCSFSILPYKQCFNDIGIYLLKGDERSSFFNKLQEISNPIKDDIRLKSIWADYVAEKRKSYLYNACSRDKRLLGLLNKLNLLKPYIGKARLIHLTNLIQNESHRDILLESLDTILKRAKRY
jgi:poly-gamma-glutamate synthesis protein (capsule biosynthesis protein)